MDSIQLKRLIADAALKRSSFNFNFTHFFTNYISVGQVEKCRVSFLRQLIGRLCEINLRNIR